MNFPAEFIYCFKMLLVETSSPGWWNLPELKGQPIVPVGGSNRDKRAAGPLVTVGGSNRN
jgi:hypothetical protein